MHVHIREATSKDAAQISSIHQRSWKSAYLGIVPDAYLDELRETFWEDAFSNWLRDGFLRVFLAVEDNEAVGCISFGQSMQDERPHMGEIVSFYMLPQKTGKGYGKMLLERALHELRNSGFSHCFLLVLEENDAARAFYESQGFLPGELRLPCSVGGRELCNMEYVRAL